MEEKIIEYAPILIVALGFLWQNGIFVKPEQLEKKHREILADVKKDYVELNAYKEFQSHVLREINDIKKDISEGFTEIKETLQMRRKDD